jgi:predicted PurR-regulated permease PerM
MTPSVPSFSPTFMNERSLNNLARGLLIIGLFVLFLFVGREFLEPLVIAALLSFILAPVIRFLRGIGIWRTPAVIITVIAALAGLAAIGSTLVVQITQLAIELPRYESTLRAKAQQIGGASLASSALERATGKLRELGDEIGKSDARPGDIPSPPTKPMLVEVQPPPPTALQSFSNLVQPLLSPLATSGLVILFLLFILLRREDLRDRFLRLAGVGDLQRTTAALDDAGQRLSRFFLMQTLLNVGFGVVIGVGLTVIGVPHAAIWGILAGLMRFVPFIGTFIAAFFPVVLAAAADPGWTTVLMTVGLFAVAEPIAGQVVEPLLYGQHTGLSPVAIVVATLFWALLWGPIGLLLATPLTVCLVVLGKHIDALNFIDVLLGDEPALEPEERFYQRLLAGDATEASDLSEQQLKSMSLCTYYDSVPMQALVLAQRDAARDKLAPEKQMEICDTVEEVVDALKECPDEPPAAEAAPDETIEEDMPTSATEVLPSVLKEELDADWQVSHPILCIASRSALDQAAAVMLAQILEKHGIPSWVQPFADVSSAKSFKVDAPDARIVCLSYFGAASSPVHVRYLIRRLRRLMPATKFLACFWMLDPDSSKLEEWRTTVGADFVASSIAVAAAICLQEAAADKAKSMEGAPTSTRTPGNRATTPNSEVDATANGRTSDRTLTNHGENGAVSGAQGAGTSGVSQTQE